MDAWNAEALLTPHEMAQADSLAVAAGTDSYALMLRAAAAVAHRALALHPDGRFVILCGPGNNGGDGLVCAALLREAGRMVAVAGLCASETLTGDAARASNAWGGPIAEDFALEPGDMVIDALFGAGLARPLAGRARDWVERLNRSQVPVLSVDLPSGIDGATGAVLGVAVKAVATTTFFRARPGHYLYPGRAHTGALEVADIGIEAQVLHSIRPSCWRNRPALWRAQLTLPPTAHKYAKGHVAVIAGAPPGLGASRLAARAALRGGAGLVTLFTPLEGLPFHLARGPDALMVRSFADDAELLAQLADPRFSVIVAGPAFGLAAADRARLLALLHVGRQMVLDADALTLLAGEAIKAIKAIAAPQTLVLTPHGGEFARLFGTSDGDRLGQTREAARHAGQVVLHKGADTVIAAPDGRAVINANAPPFLATAGAGDVLAGLIGAMLARGLRPFAAAGAAAFLHGAAAEAAGEGLIADDLPDYLPKIWPSL